MTLYRERLLGEVERRIYRDSKPALGADVTGFRLHEPDRRFWFVAGQPATLRYADIAAEPICRSVCR